MTAAEKLINDTVSPFNIAQRDRLKYLSKVRKDGNYSAMPNVKLEEYIQELRDKYPDKFHTQATLNNRVFMDEPGTYGTAYTRCVRPRAESPYNIIPVKA